MTSLSWPAILEPGQRSLLAELLLEYVRPRRWFRAKGRDPRGARIADLIRVDAANVVAFLQIDYAIGEAELYVIPLAAIDGPAAQELAARGAEAPPAIVAPLGKDGIDGALIDGLLVPAHAADALLNMMRRGQCVRGEMNGQANGQILGEALPPMGDLTGVELPTARLPRVEQTNSTAIFGDRVLLKIYRQLTAGPNPELEIGRYLTVHCQPPCAPRVLGALSYVSPAGDQFSLGIAHEYLPNQGDAFSFFLGELRTFFARVSGKVPPAWEATESSGWAALLAHVLEGAAPASAGAAPPSAAASSSPSLSAMMGRLSGLAATLGQRTGALHLALAGADPHDPDFAPEPLTADDRNRLANRAEAMLTAQLQALAAALPRLTPGARALSERLLTPPARQAVSDSLARFRNQPLDAAKTRTHGDLHLGQVLVRDGDFVIIDFEGEPARPLAERRAKSSPLRDVMGMVRSFDYAPEVLLRDPTFAQTFAAAETASPQRWATLWKREVTRAYLTGYLTTVGSAPFLPALPAQRDQLALILTFYELEKVIYEIGYEVNNRPDWVEIPLRGLATIAGLESAR